MIGEYEVALTSPEPLLWSPPWEELRSIVATDGSRRADQTVHCDLDDVTSPTIPLDSYYARLLWTSSDGTVLRATSPWLAAPLISRDQVLDLGTYRF